MTKPSFDYSTIDRDALRKLPIAKLAPTYELQSDPGNGCFGDPPGYPTYFTRSVYTSHGNTPGRGAQMVITVPGEGLRIVEHSEDWKRGDATDKRNARLRKLWKPLPLDHPRTRAWIKSLYLHFKNCYTNVEAAPHSNDRTIIYPVPSYKLKTFRDEERFNDEYRAAQRAEVEAYNRMIVEEATALCTPETHSAVVTIRGFYPDYQPQLELIDNPPTQHGGDWWERYAENFTPETCPGSHGRAHNSGDWCQMCGVHKAEEVA